MSSKFFTNQGVNTLENRLKDILSHYRVEYLEFLIGYFRISGFVKIAPYLADIKKAKILGAYILEHIFYEWQGDVLVINISGTPVAKRDAIGKVNGNQQK